MSKRELTSPSNIMGVIVPFFTERSSIARHELDYTTILSALVTADGTIITYEQAKSWGRSVRVAAFDAEGNCKYDMILSN